MTLLITIEDYLLFIQHEQCISKTTCKSYYAYTGAVHRFLTENGYPAPELIDFNAATARRFFYTISSKGLRPRSLHGYLIPLCSLGNSLVEQTTLDGNHALAVKLPKKMPRSGPACRSSNSPFLSDSALSASLATITDR